MIQNISPNNDFIRILIADHIDPVALVMRKL